ncbi:MAG: CHRD domain-containing protein [Planctomycetes bacterium]|nr:CHRD domain-containing protein [Planctomycetota bacterium]
MSRILAAGGLVLVLCRLAGAEVTTYSFPLDAHQAGVISPSWGIGVVTFDDATSLLTWDVEYHGMTGEVFASHFHGPAPAGESANVRFNVTATIMPTDPFNGRITGSGTIDATMAAELTSGLWYINIHTTDHLEGEARGQVVHDPPCIADLNHSGSVGFDDILVVIGAWGPCGLPAVATGACCSATGFCADDTDEPTCTLLGGFYQGDGSTCSSAAVDCERACFPDIDGSGDVGFGDILRVIGSWGVCRP